MTTDCTISELQNKVITLFNVQIHALTMNEVLDHIDRVIAQRDSLHIGVVNAAKIVNMHRNPALGDDVRSSNLIVADGQAVVWASRILGQPLPERVAGIELMFGIFDRGKSKGYRVYFLGATEEISSKVAARLAADYPGVVLAGRRNGYFNDDEEQAIAQDIADAKPDVLLVAITSPKKENFMARWNELMDVPVVHGVGGSFDVMAGKVERAPQIWQTLGLEWLYRVKQEPRRLWKRYLVTNSIFCWMILKSLILKTFLPATESR